MSKIHVVYNGNNELEFDEVFRPDRAESMGIQNLTPSTLNHDQIKQALAYYYDVDRSEFEDHYVEISSNGNITVRPNAKWGNL